MTSLPYTTVSDKGFKLFAKAMNEGASSVENCILKNDRDILQEEFGYSEESVKLLQSIRLKLQKRRMRNNSKT